MKHLTIRHRFLASRAIVRAPAAVVTGVRTSGWSASRARPRISRRPIPGTTTHARSQSES